MASETLAPDGLSLQTNLSGSLSSINVDDTTWLTAPNDNANAVVRVDFPTPTGDPTTGAGVQSCAVKYRVTPNASSVTFNAYICEGGIRLNGGSTVDSWSSTSTTEQTRNVTWDASLLGTADGSAAQIEIEAVKSGGAPAARTVGEFQFIDWSVEYTAGTNSYSIVGGVTVALAVAAIMAYQQHPAIVGDVTSTLTPAAVIEYQQHHSIVGGVTTTLTPAATLQAYQVAIHPITLESNQGIIGDVTATLTPAAAMSYSTHPDIVGDVTATLTPSAVMDAQRHYDITGDVTASVAVAAVVEYQRHHAVVGGVTATLTPAAVTDYQVHSAITGAVSYTLTPAAVTNYQSTGGIVGDVTVTLTPAAVTDYEQHPAIVGGVATTLMPAAVMKHQAHPAIVGGVTGILTPGAAMSYTLAGGGGMMLAVTGLGVGIKLGV